VPLILASLVAWRAVNDPAAIRALPDEVQDAVVKLSVRTIEAARTGQTLGTEREGTGLAIVAEGADGEDTEGGALILTIGYLVIEAQSVLVITRDNRVLSASVIAFDHATGFGLLRASGRVTDQPLRLGDSSAVREMQPLFFVAHEGAGGASAASVVSRRPFVGYWEYMLAEAPSPDGPNTAARRWSMPTAVWSAWPRCGSATRSTRAVRCRATCSCRSTCCARCCPT
jgi:hypothetical protein